jgi:hypothetical protein
MMTSEGESFDALSKITESEKPCIYQWGGQQQQLSFLFQGKVTEDIISHLKDNVLSKAVIQKTSKTILIWHQTSRPPITRLYSNTLTKTISTFIMLTLLKERLLRKSHILMRMSTIQLGLEMGNW